MPKRISQVSHIANFLSVLIHSFRNIPSSNFEMSDICVPLDHHEAVASLPASQNPYGSDCVLDRQWQAVFFHHDIPAAMVKKFISTVGASLLSLRLLNPDTSDGKDLFHKATKELSKNDVEIYKLKLAVRRLCRDEPLVSISKKRASNSSPSRSSKSLRFDDKLPRPSSKASSKSSSPPDPDAGASRSPAARFDDADKSDDDAGDDLVDISDDELVADEREDGVTEPGDQVSKGKITCLNQLFNRVANDVSLFLPAIFSFLSFSFLSGAHILGDA